MLQIGNVGLTLDEQRSHFSLWAISGAPLLAGNDIIHADNETLAILTAKELLEVNQDLGVNGALQGKLLSNAYSSTPAAQQPVGLAACSGGADQKWERIAQSGTTTAAAVQVRNNATGQLLAVPNCERAKHSGSPPFSGPLVAALDSDAPSACDHNDTLWTLQENGTFTTSVDGSCMNVWEGGGGRRDGVDVQTFDCARQGKETNGQWTWTQSGTIESAMFKGKCLGVVPPTPVGEVWSKPLSDGKRTAVLLLNTDDKAKQNLTVTWTQLGFASTATVAVRDLWRETDLGSFTGSFTAEAAPHAVVMLTVQPQ